MRGFCVSCDETRPCGCDIWDTNYPCSVYGESPDEDDLEEEALDRAAYANKIDLIDELLDEHLRPISIADAASYRARGYERWIEG